MICVMATIQLVEGRREDFLKIFKELVPKVQAEEGCLEYGPMVDLPTNLPAQGEVREDVVVIVEKWESIEALEAHLMAPHMLEYRKASKDLVVSTSLQILQPA